MSEYSVEVKHISKEYKLYNSEKDRLKEAFSPFGKKYHKVFHALNDINFQIQKGEKVGIIGANGAGKSTLLKIVTEVLKPSQGEIVMNGRVAALLELGAGFNQEYTGRENIRLNGKLMGDSEQVILEKTEKIIEFADIGDFIDQPVKTYSSGMFVRLAFATQIFSEPDILIVDEALSVGDIRFQQKCYRAMESLMKDKTVMLVTHDTAAVTRFCKRVIWIDKGKKVYDGDVVEGLNKYQEFLINQAIKEKGETDEYFENTASSINIGNVKQNRYIPDVLVNTYKGNGQARIYQCGFFNQKGELIENVNPGDKITCAVRVEFFKKAQHPILGLAVKDRLGNDIIGINSQTLKIELPAAEGKQEYHFTFIVPELNQGEYVVTIAIANGYQGDHIQMCWIDDALILRVLQRLYDIPGVLYMEHGEIVVYKIE